MELHLDACTVRLHDDGILDYDYRDDVVVDLDTARHVIESTREALDKLEPYPTLVRLNRVKSVTREARVYFSEHHDNLEIVSRVALIASNPIGRIVANFFLGLNAPPRPTKLFGAADEALAWLKS